MERDNGRWAVSGGIPRLPQRGFAAIALHQPKTPANVGSALRNAHCFGASLVAYTGKRYQKAATDVTKGYRSLPLQQWDNVFSGIPHDCVPVAVDLVDGAVSLYNFHHPESALYIFGPEDGTLGKPILERCKYRVMIPTALCLNLATTTGCVLMHRQMQMMERRERIAA